MAGWLIGNSIVKLAGCPISLPARTKSAEFEPDLTWDFGQLGWN